MPVEGIVTKPCRHKEKKKNRAVCKDLFGAATILTLNKLWCTAAQFMNHFNRSFQYKTFKKRVLKYMLKK